MAKPQDRPATRSTTKGAEVIAESSCHTCKWADVAKDGSIAVCKAFPTAIPEEILRGEVDHYTPVPGDHGIAYEAMTETGPEPG